jgi:hypothetical protein
MAALHSSLETLLGQILHFKPTRRWHQPTLFMPQDPFLITSWKFVAKAAILQRESVME